jgi:hypothetical protein
MNRTPKQPHADSTLGGGAAEGRRASRHGRDDDHDDHDGGALQILSPAPITLEDHTVEPGENTPGLWARRAQVVDYAIVSGSRTRAGAYVAWNCLIETFEVGSPSGRRGFFTDRPGRQGAQFTVRKRYARETLARIRARRA